MYSRLSTLTILTLLLAACDPTDTDPATELPDGGSGTATEDLTVLVYEPRETPVPLEGAVIGLSQDGVVSMGESDAEGRATFAINPDGGPITASAYLPGHEVSSVVGYEPATLRESDSLLPLYMLATTADLIQVSGEFERDPNLAQAVYLGNSPPVSQKVGERFVVPAQRGEPFILTAYLQFYGLPPSALDGMYWPLVSFRTLTHAGSENDVDVTNAMWRELDIAEHTVRVTRPRAPASLADDEALLRMLTVGTESGLPVLVADTTAHKPWADKESYSLTMSGRADLMRSKDLTTWATIYAADRERISTIRIQGVPTSVDVPFLPPAVVTTDAPRLDQLLTWSAGDSSLWTFLRARVGSERWSVGVLPGISSLDMPALLATLPTAPFRGRDLTAWLLTCESEEGTTACLRTAYSAPFTIDAGATK